MLQVVRSVSALLLGVATLQVGTGLFGTFVALRMDHEGFSALSIGGVGSAYFGGFILGAVLSPIPIRAVGHIRTFAAFAAIVCCATLIAGLSIHPASWMVFRFLHGFALSGLFMIAESWLNERARSEWRGRILALYMIANYSALGGGQFLLALAPVGLNTHFIIAALLFAASLLPVALTPTAAPTPYDGKRLSLRELTRKSPLGVIGCFACGLINSAFYALAPIFVLGLGLGGQAVAQFMGAAILAGLVLQWPLGKLSDIFDRRTILVAMAFSSAALAAAIALFGDLGIGILLVLAALYGGTAFTIYPLSVAHTNDYIDATELVPASAGLLMAYGIGAAIGPLLASLVMELTVSAALFIYQAVVCAGLAFFGLYRMVVRDSIPNEEQIPFVAVPRTSPVAGELDPRAEPLVEEPDQDDEDAFEMRFGPDEDSGDDIDDTTSTLS